MAVPYENRAHAIGNWLMGVIFTASQPRRCDQCKQVVRHLTNRQQEQARRRKRVECRGVLFGRRVCSGTLILDAS